MRNKLTAAACFCASLAHAEAPLSAIDWLDAPGSTALVSVPQTTTVDEPPVSDTASITGVQVTPLGEATPDAVGLLPSTTTGLPRSMWRASNADTLVDAFERIDANVIPAVQALLYTLLLAEADAPLETTKDAGFLKARVAGLAQLGAVDPARALLERAGPNQPQLFDMWLSLTLLSGDEDKACAVLRRDPTLSRDYAARIFCTARDGDWSTAALTYETAVAIGALEGDMAELLAQFLDPELVDVTTTLTPPQMPSPLLFRLYEAVGSPLPTRNLPRAFAMADLRGTAGWKAELEAAERLTRTGALPATRLLGLYTDRRPAASGSIWDRVRAIQRFDKALFSRDPEAVAGALDAAWSAARSERLGVPFAQLFGPALMEIELPDRARDTAFRIALLSPEYERAAQHFSALSGPQNSLLQQIALGTLNDDTTAQGWRADIVKGLRATAAAQRHQTLLDDGKLGEAILFAALELGGADRGSARAASEALMTLRAVGLEDTARRAALQLLILGPPT